MMIMAASSNVAADVVGSRTTSLGKTAAVHFLVLFAVVVVLELVGDSRLVLQALKDATGTTSAKNISSSSSSSLAEMKMSIVAPPEEPWNASEVVLPISFALPEARFARAKRFQQLNKTRDFAHIIPGVPNTYIYNTEDSYYNGYAEAYYSITMKKAGWDCFRHYEIIASGSMPFFLDYQLIPPNTMHDLPVDIIKEAMELPGVPTQEEVRKHMAAGTTLNLQIDRALFNRTKYYQLLERLLEHSLDRLTWRAQARYIIKSVQRFYPCLTQPKVLMVTTPDCDYQSCVIFGGLYADLGKSNMSSLFGPKIELFDVLAPDPGNMYGRGFSFSRVFSDKWNVTKMNQLTWQRLEKGFFNMIVFTNSGNGKCRLGDYSSEASLLYDYQKRFNPLVVVVDGSDEVGCHKFFAGETDPLQYHAHFIREYDQARMKNKQLPTYWTGCDETDKLVDQRNNTSRQ